MPPEQALIFANGDFNPPHHFDLILAAKPFVIAADGGLRHCEMLGIVPDLLIGDLDSVTSAQVSTAKKSGCQVEEFSPQKDETDLELALLRAVKSGFREVILLGGLGGRIDHTLANLALLFSPVLTGLDLKLLDGQVTLFAIHQKAVINAKPGDLVSLIPWGGDVESVTTTGLQYPLKGETLYAYRSRGVSNVMLGQTAEVTLHAGRLLCVITSFGANSD